MTIETTNHKLIEVGKDHVPTGPWSHIVSSVEAFKKETDSDEVMFEVRAFGEEYLMVGYQRFTRVKGEIKLRK